LTYWLRDIWIITSRDARYAQNASLGREAHEFDVNIVNRDKYDMIKTFAGRFRPVALLDCIKRIDEACAQVSANANFTLAAGAMLFKINELLYA
jgi:hypothetical protein